MRERRPVSEAYDFWLTLYEGFWMSTVATEPEEERTLSTADDKHRVFARNVDSVAAIGERLYPDDDAELKERHVRFFVELARALEELVPATREGRLSELRSPEAFAVEAERLDEAISNSSIPLTRERTRQARVRPTKTGGLMSVLWRANSCGASSSR